MRRDRNSTEPLSSDHSLPRSKILRGRENFRRLFEKSTVLKSGSIQFRYRIYSNPEEKCLIGFAAPKRKVPKAAHRNRVKRLLREAYRTRQSHLQNLFSGNTFGFHALFMAQNANLTHEEAEKEVEKLLAEARSRLIRQFGDPELKTAEQPPNDEFK